MSKYYAALHGSADKEPIVEEDAETLNARHAWLSSSRTQQVFKELLAQSDSLVADAIGLALVNHQSDNNKQIVHKLIEANMLRKVVGKYASNK